VNRLRKIFSSAEQRKKIERLLKESPLPPLAENHLLRLVENSEAKAINKIPAALLSALFRVLGSSAYLSEVLINQGKNWPDIFLRQVGNSQKTVDQHLRELKPVFAESNSLDEFSAALRKHKQREYLRIGARDLFPSVTMEETVRELTAFAEASLQAAYQYCRNEVEKDYGPLLLPDGKSPNRFVILGMGKLGGGELNFSSDIDVTFLYEDDEGESSGGLKRTATPREFFTSVGKKSFRPWAR